MKEDINCTVYNIEALLLAIFQNLTIDKALNRAFKDDFRVHNEYTEAELEDIRILREKHGITFRELGEIWEVAPDTIHKVYMRNIKGFYPQRSKKMLDVCKKAIAKWGELQFVKAMEEAGEFIQACSRRILGKTDELHNLEEEIADLEIMLEQIKLLCDRKKIEEIKKEKIKRLEKLLKES